MSLILGSTSSPVKLVSGLVVAVARLRTGLHAYTVRSRHDKTRRIIIIARLPYSMCRGFASDDSCVKEGTWAMRQDEGIFLPPSKRKNPFWGGFERIRELHYIIIHVN